MHAQGEVGVPTGRSINGNVTLLKLKKSKNNEINVILKGKTRFINRTFLIAFSVAFGLHLLAVILFNISPFFHGPEKIFSPIEVQTDLGFKEVGSVAIAKNEEKNHKHSFKPPVSTLEMPSFSSFNKEMEMKLLRNNEFPANAFLNVEEEWDFLLPHKAMSIPPIAIHVSGNLSQCTLIEKSISNVKNLEDFRIVYDVQVELKSGRVFWHQIKLFDGSEEMRKIADEMLKALAFEACLKGFVETGEIEFVFRKS